MANEITREECSSRHNKLMEKIDSLVEKVEKISTTLTALPANLTLELDKRYADKKTELAVDRMTWIIITFVVLAILAFVFNSK